MSPADLTEYESAPTTIEVVSVSGSNTEEQITEMGLRVDGVEHPLICNVPGPCTFPDVTLEMGEHTLEAWAMADGEISDTHRVYVGIPAPQTADTDTTGGDTTGDDTSGDDTSGTTTSAGESDSGDTSGDPEGEGCACVTTEGGLSGTRRRGILGQAWLLSVLSRPFRTSPSMRGRWVLDQLLCQNPPPPPPGLPKITSPSLAFDLLFAGADPGATRHEQARRRALRRSVLDSVTTDATLLREELGVADRRGGAR